MHSHRGRVDKCISCEKPERKIVAKDMCNTCYLRVYRKKKREEELELVRENERLTLENARLRQRIKELS